MTNQQMQFAYWQRMRQQQLYKAYAAGMAQRNAYDRIAKVSDSCFLNYIEYSPKNIDSQKAADYLKSLENPPAPGRCTGAYDRNSGTALRQLDWYYNNETEFIIKMNADPEKGVFGSIGVTASSPKLTRDLTERLVTTGQYYGYFDYLPFFTVDGVNDQGVYAQSNVVNKNGVEINVNGDDPSKADCCIVMLVRYILDHFGKDDIRTKDAVKKKLKDNLHIYGTSKIGDYNSHVLIAHYDAVNGEYNKSYVVEFTSDDIVVNEFQIMSNFRTMLGDLQPVLLNADMSLSGWEQIEWNGCGLERWDTVAGFLSEPGGKTISDFRNLRRRLDYTHAYDRDWHSGESVPLSAWLTDNLSGDLSVAEAKAYHDNTLSGERLNLFDEVLSDYRNQFTHRSRNEGNKTWITTHSAIYDLVNLSCNIVSQMSTGEKSCWNVTFDGSITEDAVG